MKKANALSVIDKITVRQLRRTAREELRALKKAGAVVVDADATERLLNDINWLLTFKPTKDKSKQRDIRVEIRKQASINVGQGINVNYYEYMDALKNFAKFNQSVQVWNALHKDEINAGLLEARRERKWTLATSPRETQETAQGYLSKWRTTLSSPKQYYSMLRQFFIDKVISAVASAVQNLPQNGEPILQFIAQQVDKHTPEHGKKHVNIEPYYEPIKVIEMLDKVAEDFEFISEWDEFKRQNKQYFGSIDNKYYSMY